MFTYDTTCMSQAPTFLLRSPKFLSTQRLPYTRRLLSTRTIQLEYHLFSYILMCKLRVPFSFVYCFIDVPCGLSGNRNIILSCDFLLKLRFLFFFQIKIIVDVHIFVFVQAILTLRSKLKKIVYN